MAAKRLSSPWLRPVRTGCLDGDPSSTCLNMAVTWVAYTDWSQSRRIASVHGALSSYEMKSVEMRLGEVGSVIRTLYLTGRLDDVVMTTAFAARSAERRSEG